MTYEKWKGDMSDQAPLDGADDRIVFVAVVALVWLGSVTLMMVLVGLG